MDPTREERGSPVAPGAAGAGADRADTAGWALPFLVAAMDTAWITPYAILAGTVWLSGVASLVAPVAIFSLLAGGQIAGRVALSGGPAARVAKGRLVLVVVGIAAAALVVAWQYRADTWWRFQGPIWHVPASVLNGGRPELPAWFLAMLVWRRGLVIGRTLLEYYDVETVFNLGLGAFGVFAAVTAAGHSVALLAGAASAAFPYLLAFFLVSLVALPVARLQTVQRQTRASRRNTTVSADWYALIIGGAVVLLGIATFAGLVLRLDVGVLFRALGSALNVVLIAFLYAVAVPLGLILSAIVWVIRQVVHPRVGQPLPAPSPTAWIQQLAHGSTAGLPPEAVAAFRWGMALALLAIVLLWIARSVFRYETTGRRRPADIVRESVWSWTDLRASLLDLLRRRSPQGAGGEPDFEIGMAGAIRRTYAEFLGLGDLLGTLRQRSQTPAEYARAVGAGRPAAALPANELTEIYARVRYGMDAPSADDVRAARAALGRVRAEASLGADSRGRSGHDAHGR
jgi:hypothetical protein